MPPLPFTPLVRDPFDDGDVERGIAAHREAGNSPEAVVAFLVNERNYLRQQNAQLWKIIEKQRVIMDGLKASSSTTDTNQPPQTPPTTTDAAQHADPSPVHYSFIQSGRDESNIKSDEPDTEPTYEPPPPERRASLMSRAGSTFSLSHKHLPSRSSSILSLENNPILNRFKDAGVVITATAATTRNSSRSTTPHTLSGIDQIPGLPSKGASPAPTRGSSRSVTPQPMSIVDNVQYIPSSTVGTRHTSRSTTPQPMSGIDQATSAISGMFTNVAARRSSRSRSPQPMSVVDLVAAQTQSAPTTSSEQYVLDQQEKASYASLNRINLVQAPQPAQYQLDSGDGVSVNVVGSSYQGSELGADGFVFLLRVSKTSGAGREEWKIEKQYSDFLALDVRLRAKLSKQAVGLLGKVPEKALFTSMSPAKGEQRKAAIDVYIQKALEIDPNGSDLLQFLCTNVCTDVVELPTTVTPAPLISMDSTGDIDSIMNSSSFLDLSLVLKEGYLMKRGKNFGGWKARYYRCKALFLDYSEGPHKEATSTISLKHCHVTPIKPASSASHEKSTHHGLVLIEFQKDAFPVPLEGPIPDSKIRHRHVLAADTDTERDSWVSVISQQILEARRIDRQVTERRVGGGINGVMISAPIAVLHKGVLAKRDDSGDSIISQTDSETSSITSPINAPETLDRKPVKIGGSSLNPNPPPPQPQPTIGGLTAPVIPGSHRPSAMMGAGFFGGDQFVQPNASTMVVKNSVDDAARAMEQVGKPLPSLQGRDAATVVEKHGGVVGPAGIANVKVMMHHSIHSMKNPFGKKKGDAGKALDPARIVFGVPLDQAIAISRISDDIELPAVVYRCIEYLDYHKASKEEGIYRLSGSATAIQQLKLMFNVDGDVDLIRYSSHIDMVDVHAIAGLLKLYLRELPNPVLTKNLHGEFLNIINLDDRNDRVTTLAHLLSQLPRANYTLLETLISHLLSIVQSSSTNKMSVMNVGIVFAPTLGVPAIVFVLMVAEFGDVFCWSDQNGEAATKMKDRIRELQDKKDGNIEIQVPVDDNDAASLDEGRDENEPVPAAGSVVPDISATHVSILGEEGLLSDSDIQKLMS